jgi:hypothetical protein
MGRASFDYRPRHAGTDYLFAYLDQDGDSQHEAAEPSVTGSVRVLSLPKQRPVLRVRSTALSSSIGRVRLSVVTHPHVVHGMVAFYLVKHGSKRLVARARTGRSGTAHLTLLEPAGMHLTFRAHIARNRVSRSGRTGTVGVTVA